MNDRVRPAEEAVFSLLVGAEHRVLPVKKLPVHGLVAGLALPVGLHQEVGRIALRGELRRGLGGEKFLGGDHPVVPVHLDQDGLLHRVHRGHGDLDLAPLAGGLSVEGHVAGLLHGQR